MGNDIVIEYIEDGKITYPKILYKYRDWNNKNHRKILFENKIYLSSPKDFEDNMDCNVPEKFPNKDELYDIFLNKSKQENPIGTRQQYRKYAREWSKKSPLANPKKLTVLINKFNKEFNDRFGVCSVTSDPSNIDMWNKYGDDSKGICIGFDAHRLFSVVGGGGEVKYVDILPVIDFINDDFETKFTKRIFFKEKYWAFEKEYRLYKFWESDTTVDRNILMPKSCIVEVIFGKNISDDNKKEIIELIQNNNPNVTIKKSDT